MIKIIIVSFSYSVIKHWLAKSILHIAIIILIFLTFPTIRNTVSAVSPTFSQTVNHSHSSTYDFYQCGCTNLGILISLSFNLWIFNSCMLFKRCPNHHVSPQYLLNFSCCLLSKHYHMFPLLLLLIQFAFFFYFSFTIVILSFSVSFIQRSSSYFEIYHS